MSSLKKFVLVSTVVAAVLGVLQMQANANAIDYWSMNDNPTANGTTCVDSVVGGHNLSYSAEASVGGGVTSATGVWGVPNTAAHFGGNNSSGGLGSTGNCAYGAVSGGILAPLLNSANGVTVEAFFKWDGGVTSESAIYAEGTSSGAGLNLAVRYDNGHPEIAFLTQTSTYAFLYPEITSPYITAGTWYYAAGTLLYNSGTNTTTETISLYSTNGTLLGSNSGSATGAPTLLTTPTQVMIGTERTDRDDIMHFAGTIDNVKLYNTVLSGAQMSLDASTNTDTPEPSTLVLLAAGLVGLLCYAWRKRR